MNDVVTQPALYYPYIHIRDEAWLKGTLLFTASVTRIVPEEYIPQDTEDIRIYTAIDGANGRLLQAVPAESRAARAAQRLLLEQLDQNIEYITKKFSRKQARRKEPYRIHAAKFNEELLDYLLERQLAWSDVDENATGHFTRYAHALHPTLGSAIMTTLGLSIARERAYDIVTPSADAHAALLATNEESVFETLINGSRRASAIPPQQARNDLAQMVVTLTGLNFRALRPQDIPKLQESPHLRAFQ